MLTVAYWASSAVVRAEIIDRVLAVVRIARTDTVQPAISGVEQFARPVHGETEVKN